VSSRDAGGAPGQDRRARIARHGEPNRAPARQVFAFAVGRDLLLSSPAAGLLPPGGQEETRKRCSMCLEAPHEQLTRTRNCPKQSSSFLM